jgi:type VI secretion system protein VasJ
MALYEVNGLPDYTAGLRAVNALFEARWDLLHPSPDKPLRRKAPLAWLHARLSRIASGPAFPHAEEGDFTALHEQCRRLQRVLDMRLPDNGWNFPGMFPAGKNARSGGEIPASPAASPAPSLAAAPVTSPATSLAGEAQPARNADAGQSGGSAGSGPSPSGLPPAALSLALRTVNEAARQLGDHFLALNGEDPRGYQLHRVALWTTLAQLPPAGPGKRTEVSCPVPRETIDMYAAAVRDKRFAGIVARIERSASVTPFWFDGHFLVCACLEGLSADDAAREVKSALSGLINRFPDLLQYTFKDGTPFASASTRSWIETFRTPPPCGAFAAPGTLAPADAEEAALLEESLALAGAKGFAEGLERLGRPHPGKNRAFIKGSILKAKYCAATGKKEAAGRILESVLAHLKQWNLLDWEPDLTVAALSLLLHADSGRSREDHEDLRALLHAYSLETALAREASLEA